MVTTLIKHEILRTRAWLAIVFGTATLLTLAGTLMAYTPWSIIQGLGVMLTIVAVSAFLFVVQLGLAFDYWRSSYRKTGYFTQSLPVKGSTIYGAKLLWGGAVTVAGLVWTLVLAVPALFAASSALNLGITFSLILDSVGAVFGAAPAWVWVILTIVILAFYVGGLAQYYFAASIGSEARMNGLGIGGPILVWFVLYMVMQVLLFVGIIAIPLGLTGMADGSSLAVTSMNFLDLMVNNQEADAMPLGFLPVMFIVTAVLIWRTVVSWNKKVSLA